MVVFPGSISFVFSGDVLSFSSSGFMCAFVS